MQSTFPGESSTAYVVVYGVVADVFDAIAVAGEVIETTAGQLEAEALIASMQTKLVMNKYATLFLFLLRPKYLTNARQGWNRRSC